MVTDQELAELEGWLRSSTLPAGLAQRARIVTLAAQGHANTAVAERAGELQGQAHQVTGWIGTVAAEMS